MSKNKIDVLRIVVLNCLRKQPFHAYALMGELKKKNVRTSTSMLYPLLQRLECEGLAKSENVVFERRHRIVYSITDKGVAVCSATNNELKMFVLPLLELSNIL